MASFYKKWLCGSAVVAIQQALNAKGANPKVDEDGVFGKGTLEAVKLFQHKKNLKADGIVGPATLAALGNY